MKILVFLLCLFISTACFAEEKSFFNFSSPYTKASIGASFLADENFENNIKTLPSPLNIKSEYDLGYSFDVGFGIGIADNVREEIEFSYFYNKIDDVGGNDFSGKQYTFSTFFNTIYDFNQIEIPFTPYLGAGIGLVSTRAKGTGMNLKDDSFGYQILAGITYNIKDNIFLDLGYKYLSSEHSDIVGNGNNKVKFDNDYHLFRVGINYKF